MAKTNFAVEDLRKRLQQASDQKLIRYGKAAPYLAHPKHSAGNAAVTEDQNECF